MLLIDCSTEFRLTNLNWCEIFFIHLHIHQHFLSCRRICYFCAFLTLKHWLNTKFRYGFVGVITIFLKFILHASFWNSISHINLRIRIILSSYILLRWFFPFQILRRRSWLLWRWSTSHFKNSYEIIKILAIKDNN